MLVFSSKIENLPKIYNFDHDLFGNFGPRKIDLVKNKHFGKNRKIKILMKN